MRKKVIIISIVLSLLVLTAFAAAGSENDPLISLSYLEQRLTELKAELIEQKQEQAVAETAVFEPLTFEAGTIVLLSESTEFIVRAGDAILVDPVNNNLPDLTAGVDIKAGEHLPLNHHLLNPRADGRGFMVLAGDQFWVMIKGDYELQ